MSDLQKPESELVTNGEKTPDLEFLKFFDPTTMSIHLKENQKPLGKKGKPGNFELVELDTKTLDRDYLEIITSQIFASIDDETLPHLRHLACSCQIHEHSKWFVIPK